MMEIRKFDRTNLKPDNGLAAQRLLPWPELNAPFEGSWCVVAPGSESGAVPRVVSASHDALEPLQLFQLKS